MTEAQKSKLAYDAAAYWETIRPTCPIDEGRTIAFAFRSYAALIRGCGSYEGLSLWNRQGRFIINIAV